jgi:hypothetical protein
MISATTRISRRKGIMHAHSEYRAQAGGQFFDHGYALLIGVGATADPHWSLPVTVNDVQAIRKILTDAALCAYPNNSGSCPGVVQC